MTDIRRVEEAQLNTWPSPRTVLHDGWVVRIGDGYTNRANSATPLDPSRVDPPAQLAAIEALYAAQGRPAVIRTRSFDDPALFAALRDGGWVAGGHSTVLGATLPRDGAPEPGVEIIEGVPSDEWRRDHARMSGVPADKRDRILASLAVPCAFAGLRAHGPGTPFVACALLGVHRRMACFHLVVTDPAHRRRGLSARVLRALLAWGHERHAADAASLQVDSTNAPALALYAGLGFDTALFEYAYWRRSDA